MSEEMAEMWANIIRGACVERGSISEPVTFRVRRGAFTFSTPRECFDEALHQRDPEW